MAQLLLNVLREALYRDNIILIDVPENTSWDFLSLTGICAVHLSRTVVAVDD